MKECIECGDMGKFTITHPDFPEDYLCDDCAIQAYELHVEEAEQLLADVKAAVEQKKQGE